MPQQVPRQQCMRRAKLRPREVLRVAAERGPSSERNTSSEVIFSLVSPRPTAPSSGYAKQRADENPCLAQGFGSTRWGAQVESVFSAVVAGPGACN